MNYVIVARFAKMTTNHVIRRIELFLSFEIILMTICNDNKKIYCMCDKDGQFLYRIKASQNFNCINFDLLILNRV